MAQEDDEQRLRRKRGTFEFLGMDVGGHIVKYKGDKSLTDGFLGKGDPLVVSDYNPDSGQVFDKVEMYGLMTDFFFGH